MKTARCPVRAVLNAQYLLCDETFDGLDPVMRLSRDGTICLERGPTRSSPHNLRELEDICDHVGLLHSGGLLCPGSASMKLGLSKVQCVFLTRQTLKVLGGLEVLDHPPAASST